MAINSELVSDMFTDARRDFNEDSKQWSKGECKGCHKGHVNLAQHWNDVGGPDNLYCECCWVESVVVFQLQELEAEAGS